MTGREEAGMKRTGQGLRIAFRNPYSGIHTLAFEISGAKERMNVRLSPRKYIHVAGNEANNPIAAWRAHTANRV